jgi:hypothetical protein
MIMKVDKNTDPIPKQLFKTSRDNHMFAFP